MANKFPSTILPQTTNTTDAQKAHLDMLAKVNQTHADALSAAAAAQAASAAWTAEVSYTPTFTGLGTPTAVNFSWTRVGNKMKVIGKCTLGTVTAAAAHISLPGSDTIDTTLIPSIQLVGHLIRNQAFNGEYHCLGTGGNAYIAIGYSGTSAFVEQNGNGIFNTGDIISVQFEVPIQGWN